MSDETPVMTRSYCPVCEPAADPIAELLEVAYCNLEGHRPTMTGDADVSVESISGSGEAGGHENRVMCAALHGSRRP